MNSATGESSRKSPDRVGSTRAAGVVVALRRVVVGFRVVALVWLWLLVAVVLVTEDVALAPILLAGGLATAWTGATVGVAVSRPALLTSPFVVVLDVAVTAAILFVATTSGAERGFTGGYPFSTVLLASYALGLSGSLPAAAALSLVSLLRLGSGEAIGSALIYLAGAGVASWGITVLERSEDERRRLEEGLAEERAERLRSQERAETAATLHDGVLQTLALIQRRAGDPAAVAGLARRQERDLRDWLGGKRSLGAGGAPMTFAQAVEDMAAEIEADHALTVDVVTVGDTPVNEAVEALVAAACEALRNVAKHAGVVQASLYAEAGSSAATVFVRDRGAGFDHADVPDDRRGISESIVGRMRRNGGEAVIRTSPGAGTEVELRVPTRGGGSEAAE